VANAVEALGQHVHQEAPDKLVRVKPHGLPAARAVDAIVLPTEGNAGVVGGNEAAVRDGPQVALSQRATYPPSAAVRQRSIAFITFN
jgi:hypothetical protein